MAIPDSTIEDVIAYHRYINKALRGEPITEEDEASIAHLPTVEELDEEDGSPPFKLGFFESLKWDIKVFLNRPWF
jgi:hypothetical protein